MKQSYRVLTLFLFTAILFSCKKSDSDIDALPTNYRIDGVQDITLQPAVSAYGYIPLSVAYVGTVQERVALSLEGVPTGCSANLSVTGGYPAFSSELFFYDTAAAPGTYAIKLVCEGAETGKKSYDFNLIIKPEPDFGTALLGSYNTSNTCSSNGTNYTSTITAGEKVNKIYFNNFDNTGTSIYGTINSTGYINIPSQTVNGTTYIGTSTTHTSNGFGFSFTKTVAGSQSYCNAFFYQ